MHHILSAQEAAEGTVSIVLHQEDGLFKEQSDLTASKPMPIIEIPLGAHLEVQLEAPEVYPTHWNNLILKTDWSFDDDPACSCHDFLTLQETREVLWVHGQPFSILNFDSWNYSQGYWDGECTKQSVFSFDASEKGEGALHFEKRETDSSDNFQPHGYDHLYFDLHVIDPEDFQRRKVTTK